VKPKKTSIRIDSELWKKFRIACLEKGLTATEVFTKLIRNWLREEERKKRRKKRRKGVKP